MTKSKEIKEKIDQLPPAAIRDLDAFVESLLDQTKKKEKRRLSQKWGGSLKAFQKKYTSLELQKKTLEWRKG